MKSPLERGLVWSSRPIEEEQDSPISPDAQQKNVLGSESTVRTAGELFPDGAAIELIHNKKADELALLFFDKGNSNAAPRIETRCRIFEPLTVPASIRRGVSWPSACLPYGSTRQLFDEVFDLISRATRLPENIVTPIAFMIFASWLPEWLTVPPLMWVVVPRTASAEPLIQLLRLLCRRALCTVGLNTATLRLVPAGLSLTMIAEVPTITRELTNTLQVSGRRGRYVAAGTGLMDLSCTKIVFASQPLRDPLLVGFPLEVALVPTRDYVPVLNGTKAAQAAIEIQAKLLQYRLANLAKTAAPTVDLTELAAPTREIAYSLCSCLVGDDELQSRVLKYLIPRDREVQVDCTLLLEAIALEALLCACHERNSSRTVSVVELTASVNTILMARGQTRQISPEIVGWKLRGLDLRTQFISGGRKGLRLDDEMRTKVHALAVAYGVRTLQLGVIENLCPECAGLFHQPLKATEDPAKDDV